MDFVAAFAIEHPSPAVRPESSAGMTFNFAPQICTLSYTTRGTAIWRGGRLGISANPSNRDSASGPSMIGYEALHAFDPASADYATRFVDCLLQLAKAAGVSDVHLQPTQHGLDIRWRLDGVLQAVGVFPAGETADVVTRLKVLAELLTYQSDVPQEGRIRDRSGTQAVEMRVSTFPTVFGERAVIRLFSASGVFSSLDQLGLPLDTVRQLDGLLRETSGALLVTGPAGSGKTTTAYASLRHLVDLTEGGRSIVSLEDPVEVIVPGVAQSQTSASAGFALHSGLKSLLRQDPEVIFVGEIRDRATAEVAFQAALTGQLMVTTFHAGSAGEAISRLSDMGLEPYVLRSALLGIVSQRLVRRLCECAVPASGAAGFAGLPLSCARVPVGCPKCRQTGYSGRTVLAELLVNVRDVVAGAIAARAGASQIEALAVNDGMVPLWDHALEAIAAGVTSPAEVRRVFGLRSTSAHALRDVQGGEV